MPWDRRAVVSVMVEMAAWLSEKKMRYASANISAPRGKFAVDSDSLPFAGFLLS